MVLAMWAAYLAISVPALILGSAIVPRGVSPSTATLIIASTVLLAPRAVHGVASGLLPSATVVLGLATAFASWTAAVVPAGLLWLQWARDSMDAEVVGEELDTAQLAVLVVERGTVMLASSVGLLGLFAGSTVNRRLREVQNAPFNLATWPALVSKRLLLPAAAVCWALFIVPLAVPVSHTQFAVASMLLFAGYFAVVTLVSVNSMVRRQLFGRGQRVLNMGETHSNAD